MTPTRERLLHALYEAAELEHDLMCTYLYAAFSLRSGEAEGLSASEAESVARWRRTILDVAREEMAHLVAVWNLTSALGGTPQFGRQNFPLSGGVLPASVVVKLAPFGPDVIQHFAHLERPGRSTEPEGDGFEPEARYSRGVEQSRLTPFGTDYETIGVFYAKLEEDLRAFVAAHGDDGAFSGDPSLQLSATESELVGIKPVICVKTALAALDAIVEQGEGAPDHSDDSHHRKFVEIRDEFAKLRGDNPSFAPAFPSARNPVLRPPPKPEGRVWIENEEAAQTVDLANSTYALMLRLIAFSYGVPRSSPLKRLAIDLSLGLMRALAQLGDRAARLPAGPSNPGLNAGVSFTALRDASPLPAGPSAARYFIERFHELVAHAATLPVGDPRVEAAARILSDLSSRARRGFTETPPPSASLPPVVKLPVVPTDAPPPPTTRDGVDYIAGEKLTLIYEGRKCIHSRFCVTGAPTVFLANVKGPWIKPDAIPAEKLVEIAHACPSGAIRYDRTDGQPNEQPPPVNLISVRENGPYAVRAEIQLDGAPAGFRSTLCRCGASKHKPFCDGSHHDIGFAATGEPITKSTDMLQVRNGALSIDPQLDGPLHVRGNLEIISGTGRVVTRVQQAKLCRCGGSATKPFFDGTHTRNGFRST